MPREPRDLPTPLVRPPMYTFSRQRAYAALVGGFVPRHPHFGATGVLEWVPWGEAKNVGVSLDPNTGRTDRLTIQIAGVYYVSASANYSAESFDGFTHKAEHVRIYFQFNGGSEKLFLKYGHWHPDDAWSADLPVKYWAKWLAASPVIVAPFWKLERGDYLRVCGAANPYYGNFHDGHFAVWLIDEA